MKELDAEKIIKETGANNVERHILRCLEAAINENIVRPCNSLEKNVADHDAAICGLQNTVYNHKPANEMPSFELNDVVYVDSNFGATYRLIREMQSPMDADILEIHRRINGKLTQIWSREK